MKHTSKYLKSPKRICISILQKYFTWLQDETYIRLQYFLYVGKILHLKNPKTFTEKLQWLKLYNRKPEYTEMVDKDLVKKHVANIIGQKFVIPTLGCWDNFDDIDFEELPDKFVLKSTNGGGATGVIFCHDKTKFDKNIAKSTLERSLKANIYTTFREWPYKNVKPKILAEVLLDTEPTEELKDYKFYCFDGKVKAMLISHGRFQKQTCFDYYDVNFNHLPFKQGGPNSGIEHKKPNHFELMISIASRLSVGIPHARIDLYEHRGKVYFGEITFFDSSGYADFSLRNGIEYLEIGLI